MAVKLLHVLPNRMVYGATYVMQSYREVEEVLALEEILNDRKSNR